MAISAIELLQTDLLEKPFTSDVDENKIIAENFDYNLSLRTYDAGDESEEKKFIKNCERMIRTCPEYHVWTEYIRDVMGFRECSITGEVHSETTVEIHHHPYNLFNIVKGVINKNIYEENKFCSFDICTSVMEIHFQMRAPFVLLLKSMHEKYHNGFLKIPMELVHGDYKWFMDNYSMHLGEETVEKITEKLNINVSNCDWTNTWFQNKMENK